MKEDEIRKTELLDKFQKLVDEDIKEIFKDRDKWLNIACVACGSRSSNIEFEKMGFKYRRCRNCDTLYVSPRPTIEELKTFYERGKSSIFWTEEFFPPVAEARRQKIFKPRAEFVAKRLSGRGCKIADVGAGFGLFLDEIKKIIPDIKTFAIEPSPEQVEICRRNGHDVFEGFLEEIEGENLFDVVVCFDLLPHAFDPTDFFNKINAITKPKGWAFVTTLNGLGFDTLVMGRESKAISPPHLNFFNPASLGTLLQKCGFVNIAITTPGELDWDIVESAFLRNEIRLEKWWQTVIRYANPAAKAKLQGWISSNNFSSYMWAIANKTTKVQKNV